VAPPFPAAGGKMRVLELKFAGELNVNFWIDRIRRCYA
jgi:hypothetical protein